MTRLEKLQRSFFENGGNDISDTARLVWETRINKLSELNFTDCLAQYSKENDAIYVNLTFPSELECQITMSTKPIQGEWTQSKEEGTEYSYWLRENCLENGVLNFNELISKIKGEIENVFPF